VIRTVSFDQSEIIKNIMHLHANGVIECDVTYGNGSFYADIERPKFKFDLDPQTTDTERSCSTELPVNNETFNSLMFDPPFLTYIKDKREHNSIMAKRFGGYWAYHELEDHYKKTAKEAYRVLKKDGVFIVKCQDIIHNHKMHCTHANMINWCSDSGFRLLDLFVLVAKHRMSVTGKNRKQQHARIYHSFFLVFKKLNRKPLCEDK